MMEKQLKEKNDELERVIKEMNEKMEEQRCEFMNSALVKHLESMDDIHEAHKELISGFKDLSDDRSTIGVKRVGELDEKRFLKACMQRFTGDNVALEHAMICSIWQETLKDPSWHPFKLVGAGEEIKQVVDEDDEKLKSLGEDWGDEVMNAVKTAVEELNEFNPSGLYTVEFSSEEKSYTQRRDRSYDHEAQNSKLSNASTHECLTVF